MKEYFISKLSEINYRMAIHEGNANRRLASEAIKILLLPLDEVPECHKSGFNKLRNCIEETIKNLSTPGITPSKLRKIHNGTAAKYIKLLMEIQNDIDNE